MLNNVGIVMEKLRHGDTISDAELQSTIKKLGPLVKTIQGLGLKFELMAVELFTILLQLEVYQDNRRRTRKL